MKVTDKFIDAVAYAAWVHARQRRKGTGAPYVCHLLRVAGIAIEHGANEDEAIAALLHDAVEDQGGKPRLADIRKEFGNRVADIVAGCSDADEQPKPPWKERKERYLAHLREASSSVRLVCAADKLDNVRAILADYHALGEAVWERFKGRREGTLWYYRSVVDALKQAGSNRLVEELDRAVADLEREAKMAPNAS